MSSEESGTPPTEEVEGPLETADEGALRNPWDRRTFLKAAALGTAAAALWQKGPGLKFGPAAAYANDLSNKPCTGGDVEIFGEGRILNAPCTCASPTSTYNAQVEFTVRNNTSADRYCIVLHLNATGGVPEQDVILRNAPGSSVAAGKSGGESFHDTIMVGTITNVPCNAGHICFGTSGVTRGKCDPGTCTTIAWSTTGSGTFGAGCTTADENPAGGQCRHQGICIAGYTVDLTCTNNCTPTCGGTVTFQACAEADPARGPLTFTLRDENNVVVGGGPQTVPADADGTTCVTFLVPVTATHTYTVTVADSTPAGSGGPCTRTDTYGPITVTPVNVAITTSGAGACNGNLTFGATITGGTGCTYAWTIDGSAAGTGSTLSYPADPDGTCHTIGLTVTCGGCTASDTQTVSQCVTTTLNCT